MSFMTPRGTRGARMPAAMKPLIKWVNGLMEGRIAKSGKAFGTMPALVLITIGRKSGIERRTPLAYIPDGHGNWLIIAAYAGAANNPAWYHNIGAHPDRVSIELEGRTHQVIAEELHGEERAKAWTTITAASKRFADYQGKTDRVLPVIRLTAQGRGPIDVG